MDFATSSHAARWLFSAEQLFEIRESTNASSAAASACGQSKKSRTGEEGGEGDAAPDSAPSTSAPEGGGVSAGDERRLLRFYDGEIVKLCVRLGYPAKVKATALMYCKRFFLHHSCITHNPARLMLTCIYLAGKIEEAYIGAEDFCRMLNQDIKAVLNNEVLLLQGLQFDLIVHSPYRALGGLIEDLKSCVEEGPSSGADEPLLSASPEVLSRWKAKAESSTDALMMGDAPLLHPPAQLALAALRSALRADGVKLPGYMRRVVRRSRGGGGGGSGAAGAAAGSAGEDDDLSRLMAALDDIDRLGMEGAQKVDVSEVQAIDKRLKAYRAPADPEAARAAASAAEKDKAERREAKLKARREQAAAAEARLLGMPQQP